MILLISFVKRNFRLLSMIGAILVIAFVFFVMRYLRHTHQMSDASKSYDWGGRNKKLRESQSGGGGRTLDTSVSPG